MPAIEALQGIFEGREERHLASVVQGLAGFRSHTILASIYEELGEFDRAEQQWRLVTQEVPRYREGWQACATY